MAKRQPCRRDDGAESDRATRSPRRYRAARTSARERPMTPGAEPRASQILSTCSATPRMRATRRKPTEPRARRHRTSSSGTGTTSPRRRPHRQDRATVVVEDADHLDGVDGTVVVASISEWLVGGPPIEDEHLVRRWTERRGRRLPIAPPVTDQQVVSRPGQPGIACPSPPPPSLHTGSAIRTSAGAAAGTARRPRWLGRRAGSRVAPTIASATPASAIPMAGARRGATAASVGRSRAAVARSDRPPRPSSESEAVPEGRHRDGLGDGSSEPSRGRAAGSAVRPSPGRPAAGARAAPIRANACVVATGDPGSALAPRRSRAAPASSTPSDGDVVLRRRSLAAVSEAAQHGTAVVARRARARRRSVRG